MRDLEGQKMYEVEFSPGILPFLKDEDDPKYDEILDITVNSLDMNKNFNEDLEKYTTFDTLLGWYIKNTFFEGRVIDIWEKRKGVISIKFTLDDSIPDEDAKMHAESAIDPDDDGNYPIKIKRSADFKTEALVIGRFIRIERIGNFQ
jgi:hypothetical protein